LVFSLLKQVWDEREDFEVKVAASSVTHVKDRSRFGRTKTTSFDRSSQVKVTILPWAITCSARRRLKKNILFEYISYTAAAIKRKNERINRTGSARYVNEWLLLLPRITLQLLVCKFAGWAALTRSSHGPNLSLRKGGIYAGQLACRPYICVLPPVIRQTWKPKHYTRDGKTS